jgi:hypothetical protein
LQIVGHSVRQAREKHHQRYAQSDTQNADGRSQWPLSNVGND